MKSVLCAGVRSDASGLNSELKSMIHLFTATINAEERNIPSLLKRSRCITIHIQKSQRKIFPSANPNTHQPCGFWKKLREGNLHVCVQTSRHVRRSQLAECPWTVRGGRNRTRPTIFLGFLGFPYSHNAIVSHRGTGFYQPSRVFTLFSCTCQNGCQKACACQTPK
jgi:hypothetical protein